MNRLFTFFVPVIVLLAGCSTSSTFTPNGKKIIFSELIDSRASKVILSAGTSNLASIEPLMDLLKAGSSDARPSVVQKRIMTASQPKNLIQGFGAGFKEVLLGLGATETKESRMVDDQYVAETTLLRCEVKENEDGIALLIEADAEIKHRMSGDVVWSESIEDQVDLVPLKNGKRMENATPADVAALISGSEEEISEAVHAATATLGRKVGQGVRNTATKWQVAPGR